jgi:hypothetical protein
MLIPIRMRRPPVTRKTLLYEGARAKLTASLPGIGANSAFSGGFQVLWRPTTRCRTSVYSSRIQAFSQISRHSLVDGSCKLTASTLS